MARLPNFNIHSIVGNGIDKDLNSATYGRHRINQQKLQCPNCNALMFNEEKTGGTLQNPKFSLCCAKGKFKLPDIPPLPPMLLSLIKQETENGRGFIERIRSYNSAFAFTSFNAKVKFFTFMINSKNNINNIFIARQKFSKC